MPPRNSRRAFGQLVLSCEHGRSVAGIHRAVAIGQLRTLARGATFGIGLADDDRLVLQFGITRDDAEALVDRAKLLGDSHPHVTVHVLRRPLA